MTMRRLHRFLLCAFVGCTLLIAMAATASADSFVVTNLVSDIPGLALITDPNLKNPWGASFSSTSPFWISDQGTSTADLFNVHGVTATQVGLEVNIPKTAAGPQGPTGQVNNNTAGFVLSNGSLAVFIFANLNGTISAWNGGLGVTAEIKATTPGAVYTGVAISNVGNVPRLFAANNSQNRIDVFDGSFTLLPLGGAFSNPFVGLVPFNVQDLGGLIYVTYAPPGRTAQIAATEGQGAVAVFDTNGNLLQQLIVGSKLASPWGLALAPAGFDAFGGDLLVGNFSYAAPEINAFNPTTGAFAGQILSNPSYQGLWSLNFGNGGNGGDPRLLYFTTGLNGEADGLFAAAGPVPEPSSFVFLGTGLLAVWLLRRKGPAWSFF
jgi:uncharacterized protein (TIGR03118 family)